MNISIGIVAYNESASISKMLHSLFQQSLFSKPDSNTVIEIVVLPNGCTDDTAIVAENTLKELVKPSLHSNLQWRVCEIEQAGKSNAWNVYVHQLSNPTANYLFLMDSDIQLLDTNTQTLHSMLHILETMPEACVAVDKPIKDVTIKENKNLMELLSSSVSGLSGSKAVEGGAAWICGQLYCARAEVLRKIWLPTKLPTQDAFLYTMIVTDGLKSTEEPNRVILAPSASHVFEAYTSINRLLRHEKWLIRGSTINELIYSDILANDNQQQDAGSLIKHRNEQDPLWLNKLVQSTIQEKGWWLIPPFILIRRFKSLLQKPLHKAILLLPLAMTAFIVDLLLSFQANLELHQGVGIGYWGKQTK
ncbi:MAG: glycosyltransferase [Symploca sp. SIO1C2]|nr:glycosyltransferase [Symploca sp. SIO1C2]